MNKKEAAIISKESKKAHYRKIDDLYKRRLECFWSWPFGHTYVYDEYGCGKCIICEKKKYSGFMIY
jgi:hypothetical protein